MKVPHPARGSVRPECPRLPVAPSPPVPGDPVTGSSKPGSTGSGAVTDRWRLRSSSNAGSTTGAPSASSGRTGSGVRCAVLQLDASGCPAVVLDPRHDQFPVRQVGAMREQLAWEYEHLRLADVIHFGFCPDSLQPVVLDVLEQLRHARPDVTAHDSLQATVRAVAEPVPVPPVGPILISGRQQPTSASVRCAQQRLWCHTGCVPVRLPRLGGHSRAPGPGVLSRRRPEPAALGRGSTCTSRRGCGPCSGGRCRVRGRGRGRRRSRGRSSVAAGSRS